MNRLLSTVGLRLTKTVPTFRAFLFRSSYREQLARLRADPAGYEILEQPVFETGSHPASYVDFECEFASAEISRARPETVLDIGSYRHFVIGLAAAYRVTSLDVRARESRVPNETVLTADAKRLALPDGSMDCVVSLCAVEHFGLGRYGDEFDPRADVAAVREMVRVLRPGGRLVVTTTVTRCAPAVAFNAHRIYSKGKLAELFAGLRLTREAFFKNGIGECRYEDVTARRGEWDVYCASFVR